MIDIDQLFAAHGDLLDEDRLEEWTNLFIEDCLYVVIPRENIQRRLPLAVIRCESRGYLQDRIMAVRETAMYSPRSQRHLIGAAQPQPDGTFTASYAVFQTLDDEITQIFSTGRYVAKIQDTQFAELRVVYDSNLVPNSIVKPL